MIEKTEAQKRTESLLLAGLKSRRAKEKAICLAGARGDCHCPIFSSHPVYFYWHKGYSGFFPILCHAGSIAGSRPA